MNRVTSIIGSSAEVDTAVAGLPEPVRATAQALIDELERRRASDYATGQRGRDAKHQRKASTVWRYIKEHKTMLNEWPPHRRADILHTHMQTDLDCDEAPSVDFLRPILREAIEKGVLNQNGPLQRKK